MIGILPLDKPAGPTSHDAVDAVRRALGERRVGHFGTLDPFATGLLVLGVGRATRLAPFCADHDKTYRATLRLGATSDTHDPDGTVEPVEVVAPPSEADVASACGSWIGEVDQVPPIYSAKKVGGRRAYRMARAGEAVDLEAARVRIDAIDVVEYAYPDLVLEIRCGAGTYVRALARDLGDALGTGAYCATLRRTRSGPFEVGDALAWDDLDDATAARGALLPAETAVAHLPAADLDEEAARAAGHGRPVPAPVDLESEEGWVVLRGPDGLIGLAERADETLQPRRVLFPEGETAA